MRERREREADRDAGIRRLPSDERGISTTLGYALSLTVATLLVGGLLIAGGGFVEDQRERTVRSELRVIGQQVSTDVGATDRLASTAETGDVVVVSRDLPAEVTGVRYTIAVETDESDEYLTLSTDSPDVSVRVNLAAETPVAGTEVSGGDVQVRVAYGPDDSKTLELEVQDD